MNLFVNVNNLVRIIEDLSGGPDTPKVRAGYVGTDKYGERWFAVNLTARQVREILRKLGPGSRIAEEYESR